MIAILSRGTLVHRSTSACSNELVHSAGARIALDTHGDALRAAVDQGADIVKVDVQEAAAPVAPGSGDALVCARLLHERRGRGWLTVVTAGERGALAVTDTHTWSVAPPAAGPFPIGSGDTFLAALVVGLERANSVSAALALVTAAAAANAQVLRAGVFDFGLAAR